MTLYPSKSLHDWRRYWCVEPVSIHNHHVPSASCCAAQLNSYVAIVSYVPILSCMCILFHLHTTPWLLVGLTLPQWCGAKASLSPGCLELRLFPDSLDSLFGHTAATISSTVAVPAVCVVIAYAVAACDVAVRFACWFVDVALHLSLLITLFESQPLKTSCCNQCHSG